MKTTPHNQDPKKAAYWKKFLIQVQKKRKAGTTLNACLEKAGVNVSNYYYWRNRLARSQ